MQRFQTLFGISFRIQICPSPLYSGEKVADRPDEGVSERLPREKSLTALPLTMAYSPEYRGEEI